MLESSMWIEILLGLRYSSAKSEADREKYVYDLQRSCHRVIHMCNHFGVILTSCVVF